MTTLPEVPITREDRFVRDLLHDHFEAPDLARVRAALRFYILRVGMRRTTATMEHIHYMTGGPASRLDSKEIRCPSKVRLVHPRVWLALMAQRGVKGKPPPRKGRSAKSLGPFRKV